MTNDIIVTIPEGYFGMCTYVSTNFMCEEDAKVEVFQKWDPPMPATIIDGVEILPEVKGVRVYMCVEHAEQYKKEHPVT